MAVEWGPHGVRVNAIVPGVIEGTEGAARLGDLSTLNSKEKAGARMAETGGKPKEMGDANLIPAGRNGKGDDIADMALFLACDASRYTTGSIIDVDGGLFLTAKNFPFFMPGFTKIWRSKI